MDSFWSVGLSGFLIVLGSVGYRYFLGRPKIQIRDTIIKPFPRYHQLKNKEMSKKTYSCHVDVRNLGKATLDNPRVWCVSMGTRDPHGKIKLSNFVPFELNWTDSPKELPMGAIFPGNFNYSVNILNIEDGIFDQNGYLVEDISLANILRRETADFTDNVYLYKDLKYEMALVISNDNILIPAHFVHLEVFWTRDSKTSDVIFNAKVISQNDLIISRSIGDSAVFEWRE